MSTLLDDVLNLSRINNREVSRVEVSGTELVDSAIRSLSTRIENTEAKILVAADLPALRVNYIFAKQAVVNLIGNALKFTEDGQRPEIEISPYGKEDHRRSGIEVRDRGPGVPEQSRERIFRLFQRAVGRDVDGTGAGLAIVKQIAMKHGGDAWCEPRKGGGSKFVITFSK